MRRSSKVGRSRWASRAALACAGAVAVPVGAATASAAETTSPVISVELNKLEPQESGCRVYLVLTNGGESFDAFKLDVVLFDPQGVITRRLAVDAAPLRAAKRAVKLFDVQGSPCETIGTVLINDVLECSGAAGPVPDCVSRVAVSSRAGIEFLK